MVKPVPETQHFPSRNPGLSINNVSQIQYPFLIGFLSGNERPQLSPRDTRQLDVSSLGQPQPGAVAGLGWSTTGEDRWVLARSLRDVTLWSLYSHLPGSMMLEDFDGIEGLESIKERFRVYAAFGHEQLDVSIEEILAN